MVLFAAKELNHSYIPPNENSKKFKDKLKKAAKKTCKFLPFICSLILHFCYSCLLLLLFIVVAAKDYKKSTQIVWRRNKWTNEHVELYHQYVCGPFNNWGFKFVHVCVHVFFIISLAFLYFITSIFSFYKLQILLLKL